ncbi:hypothetical protein REPUB_Repub08aG0206800 [Reevesia pubescens]
MSQALQLPVIDLSSEARISTANSIRQACLDLGFFYLVNHGVEEELLKKVFEHSKKFFSLPVEEKLKFAVKNHRGYTGMYDEKLDTTMKTKGDSKESFYVGPLSENHLNQWPPEDDMPSWRSTMEAYYNKMLRNYHMKYGKTLQVLQDLLPQVFCDGVSFFNLTWTKISLKNWGHLRNHWHLYACYTIQRKTDDKFRAIKTVKYDNVPLILMLGVVDSSSEEIYGASAHSDYGMVTLLLTDGVPGLQAIFIVCRDKSKQPQVWEDVPSITGAFIVNIGDMLERWTNCLFLSTIHRVMPTGEERYSVAFFLEPSKDCIVECLESCCSESCPPRFPPIRSSDYLEERFKLAAMASAESHRINL